MVLTLQDLEFPDQPETVYYDGPMSFEFEFRINMLLQTPIIIDIEGNKNRISLVDRMNNIKSLRYVILNEPESSRTGNYKIRVTTHSKYFSKGTLRMAGTSFDASGKPIFIRRKYELA